MHLRPPAFLLLTLFLATFSLLVPGAVRAQDASETGGSETADGPRIWWNMERFAEPLGLTEEQQTAFDGYLREYLETRRESGRAHQQARREMLDALLEDDWEAVDRLRERVESTAVTLASTELDFRLRIFRGLDKEQRAKMADEFPVLLRRSWILGGLRPRERGGPRADRRRGGS